MVYHGYYNPSLLIRPFVLYDSNVYRPRFFRATLNCPYVRPPSQSCDDGASVSAKKTFEVDCDVSGFSIDEIKVSVLQEDGRNVALVVAKKSTKEDNCLYNTGNITEITRRFVLPNECDFGKLNSQLSSDGLLTIIAPYDPRKVQRTIPILQTGEPSRRGAVQTIKAKGG